MKRFTAEELRQKPTLCVGQADDLKVEIDTERVWLSRCTVEDGEPYDNKVTVETLKDGKWITTEQYEG